MRPEPASVLSGIRVFPKPTHPEYGALDGAYVSRFVNEPVRSAAEAAATGLIEQQGSALPTRSREDALLPCCLTR
jgi:hypothetical protein